ncbi:MAG: Uma2 family endonuclease [Sporichthyaceae bacterium]
MKVVMLDAPQAMLDERRRLGLDGRDEMWDGVLHMVPPAGGPHQRFGSRLFLVLAPLALARGLEVSAETGLFESDVNYRVPDQLYYRPEHASERGAEGGELVIEVRSPKDESYRKLDFYAALGVREVFVLHPDDRRVEMFAPVDGQMRPVSPDPSGRLYCAVLGVSFSTVGGLLRVEWADGSAEI